jgi:EAL domain-containing protein (putative c-di-GMP-specific phosphodiesterase class I)
MGLSVVAEGVENEQQCEYLRQIGCDCLQGFFFGRPLPVDEFEKRWFSGAEGAQCLLAAVE